MKTNQLKKLSAILIAGGSLSLAACNGGATGSGSGNQINGGGDRQAKALHSAAKKPIFSQSTCLSAAFSNTTGSGQSGHTLLTVSNNCGVNVTMDKHPIVFSGVDNHGENVAFGYHGSGGVVHEKDNWNGSTARLMDGEYFGEIPASGEFHGLSLHAGSKVVYDVPVAADPGAKFDQDAANKSMYVLDADAPVEKADGIMFINIDTTKAGCNLKTDSCAGLQVSINDLEGKSVQSFVVPKEYLGQEYTQPVDGLYNNQKYTVNVLPLENTKTVVTPKTITLNAEDLTQDVVSVKVTKDNSVKTGTVKITLPSVLDSYTGTLHVDVINTKAKNEVVAGADIKQGKSFNAKLPVSDATHEYVVKTSTGLADLAQNKYFVEDSENKVEIKTGNSNTFTIPMVEAKHETHPLTVKVTGLAGSDNANLSFQDLGNKYSYVSTQLNTTTKYQVETGLTLGISASIPKGKTEYANGVVVKSVAPKVKNVSIEFHQGKNPQVEPVLKPTNQYRWAKTAGGDSSAVSASPDGSKAVITGFDGQIKLLDIKSNKMTNLGYKDVHPLMGNINQRVDVNWSNGTPRIVVAWGANIQYYDGVTWKSLPNLPYSVNSRLDMSEISVDWSNTTPRIAIASTQYDLNNLKPYGEVYLYNSAEAGAKWEQIYSANHEVGEISLAPGSDKVIFYVHAEYYGTSSLMYYNNGSIHSIADVTGHVFQADWSKDEPRVVYSGNQSVQLLNVGTNKTTTLYKFNANDYQDGPLDISQVSVKWEANDANIKAVIAMDNGAVEYAANGRTTELFGAVAGWNENGVHTEETDSNNPFARQISNMQVNWNSNGVIPSIVLTRMVNETDSYGWYTGNFHPELYAYNNLDGSWYSVSTSIDSQALSVVWGSSGFADKILVNSPLQIATLK